jgi:GAF domain-containing protein
MQQLLFDAERAAASARSVHAALKHVARTIVPRAADFCLIFLVRGMAVRCVAAAHATAEGQRLLRSFLRAYTITITDPVSTVAHVVRTGRPRLRGEIHSEDLTPLKPLPVLTLHHRLAPRSALVVPIGATPRVLGAISMSYAASGRRYTPQDVASAMRLAALTERIVVKRVGTPADVPPPARRSLRLRARS